MMRFKIFQIKYRALDNPRIRGKSKIKQLLANQNYNNRSYNK